MYETQLLRIRIRPGKTDQVLDFIRSLKDREGASLEALRREGMVVESLFLERQDECDYLYYYVKARDLAHANQVNMQATDPFTQEIRKFISDTWGEIACPEPLLDLDLIHEESAPRPRRRSKPLSAKENTAASADANPASHALAGG